MATNYISTLQGVLADSIAWMLRYQPESQALDLLKEYRRRLRLISFALEGNCAVAAYGESQVGKSYLMSSLLASSQDELRVDDGSGRKLSFINELNPSGGSTGKEESTGVITRFTIQPAPAHLRHLVRISTLSIVDIVLMLCDAYYKDVRIDPDTVLQSAEIDAELQRLHEVYTGKSVAQEYIIDDDIYDIYKYIKDVIGNPAVNVIQSKLRTLLAPCIAAIPVAEWGGAFSLLWNRNEVMTSLFQTLIQGYERLAFSPEVYVPFDAVLASKGTILKVNWLDLVAKPDGKISDGYLRHSVVYGSNASPICESFDKSILSALTAELTFVLPAGVESEKPFLKQLDLLDFPGSRRRETILERDLATEQGNMLRRGKVAYLFNKYSRALRINSILFCQHQDMTGQSEMGESLDQWIGENIGRNPEDRSKYIAYNQGVSPFFIVATKFNTDLKWTNETRNSRLADRWRARFDNTLANEVIKPETYSWFNNWIGDGGGMHPFQGIYLLRDFFWSRDQQIFRGYAEGRSSEVEEILPSHYEDYRQDLKQSFLNYPFVQRHFANPAQAWDCAATVGNDGSQRIIDDLGRIAGTLNAARHAKYQEELLRIVEDLDRTLSTYYVPADGKEQAKRVQQIIASTKLALRIVFAKSPDSFGNLIEKLMIDPLQIRQLAYDIIVRKTLLPVDLTPAQNLREGAGVCDTDSPQVAIEKMCNSYHCSNQEELESVLVSHGLSLQEVVCLDADVPTTTEELLCQQIVKMWSKHIHTQVGELDPEIKHREHIGHVLIALLDRVRSRKDIILDRIQTYMPYFPRAEQIGLNSISDSVAVLLNNFVTNNGADYLLEGDYSEAEQRALVMKINTDSYSELDEPKPALLEMLEAFDKAKEIIKRSSPDQNKMLHHLPWWSHAKAWTTSLVWGMLVCAEVSIFDREANDALALIMNQLSSIKASRL